jgi:hypothetical protein
MEPFMVGMVFLGIPVIIAWTIKDQRAHNRLMKVLQLKAEMNARLLDRLGTDPAALDLLKGDTQQKMFDLSLPDPGANLPAAQSRVLTSAQVGLMLLSAGFGLLYIRQYIRGSNEDEFVLVLGTLGVALGVGAVLSAIAAVVAIRLWQGDEGGGRRGAMQ